MKMIEFDTEPRMPIFNIYGEALTLTSVAPPLVCCPAPVNLSDNGAGVTLLNAAYGQENVCLVLRLKRANLV